MVKSKKKSPTLSRKYDTKHIGDEPIFDEKKYAAMSDFDQRMFVQRWMNWYNYMYDIKRDFTAAVVLYGASIGMSQADQKMLKRASFEFASSSALCLIRMSQRGFPLTSAHEDKINGEIDELLSQVKATDKEKAANEQFRKKAVDTTPKYASLLWLLETWEDALIEGKLDKSFSLYNLAKSERTTKGDIDGPVREWVTSRLNEYRDHGKADYTYSAKELKDIIAKLEEMLEDVDRCMVQPKRARVVRTKKATPVAKQVAKLKYQKESIDLKLVSVNPEQIIGAQVLYLLNTKYNRLTKYTTSSRQGFEIKGSTLQNVSTAKTKTLRSPEKNLIPFLKTNSAKNLEKMFDELTTKESDTSNRINEHSIIMKVIR